MKKSSSGKNPGDIQHLLAVPALQMKDVTRKSPRNPEGIQHQAAAALLIAEDLANTRKKRNLGGEDTPAQVLPLHQAVVVPPTTERT